MSAPGADVFISYAQDEDHEPATALVDRLEGAGATVWIAERSIDGAQNYADEIVAAIDGCKVVVALCSQASMQSRHVAVELTIAFEAGRPRLPLMLDDTPFVGQNRYWLADANRIDISGPIDQWFPKVRRALSRLGVRFGADAPRDSTTEAHASAPPGQSRAPFSSLRDRLTHPWRWLVGLGILAAVAAAFVVIATSGGSSGSGRHPPVASRSLTEAQAAEQYLAATEPVNVAGAAFNAQARNFTSATTSTQAGSAAGPLSAALQAATVKLDTIAKGYAAGAAALRGDIDAAAALERDLGSLARLNRGLMVSAWDQQFAADTAKAKSAANVARAALGLAPVD